MQSSPALKFGIAFNEASPGYEAMPGACGSVQAGSQTCPCQISLLVLPDVPLLFLVLFVYTCPSTSLV